MTNFSKCLAVFATVASLAFLGIVSVSAVGGPNYEAELESDALRGLTFEKKVNEETGKVTWSARTNLPRPTDPNNPNSPVQEKVVDQDSKVLAKTLIKSYALVNQEQSDRLAALEKQIKSREQSIAEAKQLIEIDMKALDARIAGLQTLKAQSEAALKTIQDGVADSQQKDAKKRAEAKRREDDITRIQNQITEMIAEKSRLDTQKSKLEVLKEELQLTVQALQRRNNLLRKNATTSGATSATAAPVAKN